MKTFLEILMPVMLFAAIETGCTKADPAYRASYQRRPVIVRLIHLVYDIENADTKIPSGDSTLLWDSHKHAPILAPDGHQLTLGEFRSVTGDANVEYLTRGTMVDVTVRGLVPNGVYSVWLHIFQSPGSSGGLNNIIGNGAVPIGSGNNNIFTASRDGTASFSTLIYNESLSVFGSVGGCLCSAYEVHVVAAYRSGNNASDPYSPDSWVSQFAFEFNDSRW